MGSGKAGQGGDDGDRARRPDGRKSRGDVQVWIWSYADATGGSRFTSFELREGKVTAVPNMTMFD
jgi:hypothetical protein